MRLKRAARIAGKGPPTAFAKRVTSPVGPTTTGCSAINLSHKNPSSFSSFSSGSQVFSYHAKQFAIGSQNWMRVFSSSDPILLEEADPLTATWRSQRVARSRLKILKRVDAR